MTLRPTFLERAVQASGLAFLVAGANACSRTGAEPHSVSWYQAHDSEMTAKVTWCKDDQARAAEVDCKNALQAFTYSRLGIEPPAAAPK